MFSNVISLTRRHSRTAAFILFSLILLLAFALHYLTANKAEQSNAETVTTVQLVRAGDTNFSSSAEAVGTVEAVSEARLLTESGGRVVSVPVEIGSRVAAGGVIASLESRAERAALLQAQGAYEAALAGAQSSNISVEQAAAGVTAAENAAASALKNSYSLISNGFFTILDDFYGNPESSLPGVRLSTGQTDHLNQERVAFQTILSNWQQSINSPLKAATGAAELRKAEGYLDRTVVIVDLFIAGLNQYDQDNFQGLTVKDRLNELSGFRNSLNASRATLEASELGLADAAQSLEKAELGGTSKTVSAANAQVKIALGSLRAAQAAFDRTIVRSPINGTVNALYVKTGDYVAPNQAAAIVANNRGLQIRTAVALESSQGLAVGDTVDIDGTATGTVTAIAGAIDPTTGKVAVKVSVSETAQLSNGATVTLNFRENKQAVIADSLTIPLAALKMTGHGPVVFFVTDGKLIGKAVVLGSVKGENIVVREGLTREDSIVKDARGLKEGQAVTVTSN